MIVVYLVVWILVTALLLFALLFPFWKVWARIKSHHQDIWKSAGPFEPLDMLRSPGLIEIFLKVIQRMSTDKPLQEQDPELARWVRGCMEYVRIAPVSILGRMFFAFIFFGLSVQLTKLIVS